MKTKKPSKDLSFSSRDSFIDLCNCYPAKNQFIFHAEKNASVCVSGNDLSDKVNRLGSVLQTKVRAQEKIIIVFPQGLEYLYGLLACFHANVVAIPVPVTDTTQTEILIDKITAILKDCQVSVILTNADTKNNLEKNQALSLMAILDIDSLAQNEGDVSKEKEKSQNDVALLFYTSGSTSRPKGVVVSHESLMSQAKMAAVQWAVEKDSCIVSWMPQFHNFGLHLGVLVPLLKGASSVILPPGSFIHSPGDWFQYIDRYQATHIAAPNFAFDYCCSLIDISSVETLSLKSLKAIISGGEANRKETHDNFMNKFRCLGLKENVFCPHYGLSETGSVTTKSPGETLRYFSLDIASLTQHKVKHSTLEDSSKLVASCGALGEGLELKIVNPDTGAACSAEDIGEIWLKSASQCSGYTSRNNDAEDDNALNVDNIKDGFICTGDLGFVDDNHLYIVGREKEVMIIHGKNHHPVDVEWTIKNKIPQLTLASAVFSCDILNQERIIVVQEIEQRDSDVHYSNVIREIIAAVSQVHEVTLYDVFLVKKGSIPKTGIGKIQRKLCRSAYLENSLDVLHQYRSQVLETGSISMSVGSSTIKSDSELADYLKKDIFYPVLDVDVSLLEQASTFLELGIDSIQYVRISKKIEEVFNFLFQPVMLFKHSSFQELAQYLSTQIANSDTPVNQYGAPHITPQIAPQKNREKHNMHAEKKTPMLHHGVREGDIAIVGMSCHFPGGSIDPDAFWDNLVKGNDCITPIADSRPRITDFFRKNDGEQSGSFPRWGGFMEDVDCFDSGFFNISPLEAESMDPQQRKALELTWSVIENSGYNPRQLAGHDVGLFLGVHSMDYADLVAAQPMLMDTYGAYLDSGLHMSMVSNRVSRWFDFHGPSEVINTACSSSLVAIHHAVASLCQGDSSVAIAGGINLLLAPRIYLACQHASMLSEDGRCKTFDEKANGFVRAEGYGAVLLKPHAQALEDNDTVYGVIKGVGINHDGHSNSLRAPSLKAQKKLIQSAYEDSGIAPDTVNYIEAHGTGTSLGDPIEVQALSEAFQGINPDIANNFCGLGTVKTNIGHCESAAGIAGLIKVLLAMKHQTLPGVLHFENINPYITLHEKPFYVVEKTQQWQRLKTPEGEEIPRRAGVSSFGFGGANAHLIVEEHLPSYQHETKMIVDDTGPVLIIFSAHHQVSLRACAEKFLVFIRKSLAISAPPGLPDMAYTLQVGRESMDERVVFLVKDIQVLTEKLDAFLRGEKEIEDYWTGSVKQEASKALLLENDDDSKELVHQWMVKGKLEKIAQLWSQGGTIDWDALPRSLKPQRIGLPTYAFVKERYWIPENDELSGAVNRQTNAVALHPLLHTNTSDFVGQRFSTTFSGEEFFLADHVVKGQRILPGVAQIEMAIAAVKQSLEPTEHASGLQLKNIIWVQPVIATNTPASIHISLQPEAQGEIGYEIYSTSPNTPDAGTVIHSQGCITLHPATAVSVLDIAALQSDAESAADTQHVSARECYQAFADMGLNYGPAFQGLEELFVSSGQILARISLPESAGDTQDCFTLPPSLMDAALQATIGFRLVEQQDKSSLNKEPELPFALDALELLSPCPDQLWARIRRDEKQNNNINKLNIDLCDLQGHICIRMTGLSLRAAKVTQSETLLFQPHWQAQSAPPTENTLHDAQHIVMLIDPDQHHLPGLQQHLPDARIIDIQSPQKSLDQCYQHHVTQVFNEIREQLDSGKQNKVLLQVVTCRQKKTRLFNGLSGLLKTAQLENPKIIGQLLGVSIAPEDITEQTLLDILENGRQHPHELHILHDENGQRQIQRWQALSVSTHKETSIPWKKNGIYLITGGAGELGLHLAKAIIEHSKETTLILTGRSVLDDVKQQQREQIQQWQALSETGGATVEYHSLDVSQRSAVDVLVQDILQRHGTLTGIIHSAGVLRDNFILKKEVTELHTVLAPKVSGIINLDEASKDIELDLFVVYSSIAATLGNPGQSDYASANAFMDTYVHERNRLVTEKQRHGHSLSINWPLWQSGGMHVDQTTEKLMKERMGITPMSVSTGIEALYHAIASRQDQIMVLHGNPGQLRALLEKPVPAQENKQTIKTDSPGEDISSDILREKANHYFKKLLSGVLRLPVARIDAKAPMEDYGIDSVMVMQLTSQLEKSFGSLSKTLFFEYQSIAALTGYFLENDKALLIELMGIDETASAKTETKPATKTENQIPAGLTGLRNRSSRYIPAAHREPAPQNNSLDIAIIGVSGRYPQARNLDEFWNNLKDGKDCITEVPKERWDHSLYFDEDKNKPGKTYSKWGGFLEGVDEFDPLFFNISPKEAELMDPQERLFLECVFAAMEDAGHTRDSLGSPQATDVKRDVGVYVGVMYDEYQLYGARQALQGKPLAISGSASSIANRVSYYFGFHGPSMAIDTMCSSSLTAIHLACRSLQHGECGVAIAGGVNVSIHPNKYLLLAQNGFASSKGLCESFGEGGDGYVPGEGVGAVLLKPVSRAIEDGDNIYGIIKAAAINHGGKTNGYTVPNPNAQAEVIGQVFKKSGIDPRKVSYIDAHGTGTSLGDPIEIAGLKKAFETYTTDKQFCAIGSAKSNIGHCESAAGIAAITKILLQLKHKKLAPSLHSEELNSNIDFEDSPFVVQQQLADWKRPVLDEQEYPRLAGVSSFGAGGSNAHVLIEEYVPNNPDPVHDVVMFKTPAIILLSAATENQLKEQTERLSNYLKQNDFSDSELHNIAFSLQVGREAMEERLAIVVSTMDELKNKLSACAEGQDNIEDVYRGQVTRNKDVFSVFSADNDMGKTIDSWIEKEKFEKVLSLWVKGLSVDWNTLYGSVKPRRISLPTYPFARERYWVPESDKLSGEINALNPSENVVALHPLLHANTSDFVGQRFSTTFSGEEFFLSDHVVKGQRILPGVAQIEMAIAAVKHSLEPTGQDSGLQLKNIVWVQPVIATNAPANIHISLQPEAKDEISYDIYSDSGNTSDTNIIIHSQGRITLHPVVAAPVLDIAALQNDAESATTTQHISAQQCYQAFADMGLDYGPAFQGLEELFVSPGQILAKISLPESARDTQDRFTLPPSLLDAALQATVGFSLAERQLNPGANLNQEPGLPFALDALEVFSPCPDQLWARIRRDEKQNNTITKLNIDLCDSQGRICVRMTGLSLRAAKVTQSETLLFQPHWQAQPVAPTENALHDAQHIVMFIDPDQRHLSGLQHHLPDTRIIGIQSPQNTLDQCYRHHVTQVFNEIKAQLSGGEQNSIFLQVIIGSQHKNNVFSGLDGLLKTARLENPKITGQLIGINTAPEKITEQALVDILENGRQHPHELHIRHDESGQRQIQRWQEFSVSTIGETPIPWKKDGIYLITGGAGELGLHLAQTIVEHSKEVTLILTGRSVLDDIKQQQREQIQQLQALGVTVEYHPLDVSQRPAVDTLIQDILQRHGTLNGIIHSAGILRDNFILKKETTELHAVLAPKVSGIINLDEASKDIELDLFVVYSSIAATLGNPGQSDYASANAFMDAYVHNRNRLVTEKQRHGHSLSINWPLWQSGGMHVDPMTEKLMKERMGITPMPASTGTQALCHAIASGQNQIMVLHGNPLQLRALLESPIPVQENQQTSETDTSTENISADTLKDKANHYFKQLLSGVLKLPVARINAEAPMEDYGIDSVMIMQLTSELEKSFGSLSKTLFFEYQSIAALTGYFLNNYKAPLIELMGIDQTVPAKTDTKSATKTEHQVPTGLTGRRSRSSRYIPTTQREPDPQNNSLDIAIIGISGRYPQARNLDEFWNNLKDGKNCITEVPKERWDHSLYFDEDKNKPGKTYSKWGGFLDGVDEFDPLFFNISPKEAELMDPQERLFLECVFEAMEDAGHTRDSLGLQQATNTKCDVGVYVGVMYEEYQLYGAQRTLQGKPLALSGSPSSIANRVSYYFDFHGPSMASDTMCSSSLTAIHLACRSLQHGECGVAIAGGVNVSIHPNKYLLLAQAGFVSSKGLCESFGQGGDGYVPGEGVGAVLLKPVAQAIADGDNIYGVIKAAAINHDGKTNGYTVPNPNAQADVIGQVFKKAGIDPRKISYIDAHGTGTSLGDPIEIAGLKKAFETYTTDKQFCAIGSAKSNIGHCESAAGIAAITKVLLQLKHKKLVPSLHSSELNSNIDFEDSPFVVQQQLADWERPVFDEQEYPRLAGVSSFGAGGSNAHVLIEEYVPNDPDSFQNTTISRLPAIILLSAATENQLKEQTERLLHHLQQKDFSDSALHNIAFSLQVGRKAMEERLAIIVNTVDELEETLNACMEGQENIDNVYRDQVTRNKEAFSIFSTDDDMGKTIDSWIEKEKFEKLLSLWVKGLSVDWNKLYGNVKPRRISLPTYPFARERYWVPESDEFSDETSVINPSTHVAVLHPLLHANTSDLVGQRFSSIFNGEEFFLADHVVKEQRILPGVAQIEMAIAAVKHSLEPAGQGSGLQLKNIVWVQPVIATNTPANVHISLQAEGQGEISYDIYSDSGNTADADIIIHSQGHITLHPAAAAPVLNITALQKDAESAVTTQHISAQQCYLAFADMGLNYGPAFQSLKELFVSPGHILAKISLPECARDTQDRFTLPPSLLDAALQATIGFRLAERQTNPDANLNQEPELPFALDALDLLGPCPDQLWARIRRDEKQNNNTLNTTNTINKLNIDLCDLQGRIFVRMTGLSLRAAKVTQSETLLFQPHWQAQLAAQADAHPNDGQRIVMLIDPDQQHLSGLKQHLPDARIIGIQSPQAALEQRYQHHITQVFNEIKQQLAGDEQSSVLLQIIIVSQHKNNVFSGLDGLLKTARLENPKIIGQLIEINAAPEKITKQALIDILDNGRQHPHELHIRHDENGQYQIQHWQALPVSEDILVPWKKDGIYLITGGAGELGLHLAQTIIEHSKGATLILTGRSVLDDVKQQQREQIQQLQTPGETGGATVEYHPLDVSQRPAVDALVQDILQRHGTLNGIIHSAGVLRDNFILKKDVTELHAVLAPKVSGIINLDEASKDIALDLFVVYSSIAATLGNPGQSDYASANAFMDAYIHDRNRLVTEKQRHGHSLSINWPLWQSSGMQVDPVTEKLMKEHMGIIPMPATTGTQALCHAIASGQNQVMVLHGNPIQLNALLERPVPVQENQQKNQQTSEADTVVENISADTLKDKANHYFKKLLSGVLKLPVARINAEAPMEDYGIDSVMIMQLTSELEKSFGSLSKTLFFEYQSITALTGYFLNNYKAPLTELMGIGETVFAKTETKPATKTEHQVPVGLTGLRSRSSRYIPVEQQPVPQNNSLDIAIIGISGRYPQARNLDEFWNNLKDGKDCITEVPKERWDHSLYFDEDKNKPGKTYSKWGGFLDGVDEFDPLFFNISPKEAELMDPQERLFLECVFAAMEDAGHTRDSLRSPQAADIKRDVGVYVGVMYDEYPLYGAQQTALGHPLALSGSSSSIANRVSYYFDFHGPCMAIDTMCSSSLTAIHLACRSLQHGECEVAIAGGVNVSIHPNKYLLLSQAGFFSSKGLCESFGQGGDGYVPGEGVGAVLLKPVSRAIEDGDNIYGVIKAAAINHDGKTNGYTVPNPNAQAEVIGQVFKKSGIDPRKVSYIDAHGTGTSLGDPIEIAGLKKAFETYTTDKQFCAIGSAKSNIGHCESAAGIAAITKILLQLKHKKLAPSLHSSELNSNIDFEDSPFVVQQQLADWKRPVLDEQEYPRLAGVSSFGAGGSNAHVLIEEYVPNNPDPFHDVVASKAPAIILLSAATENQLKEQTERLLDHLQQNDFSDSELHNIAFSLQVGRKAMEERLAIVVSTVDELEKTLNACREGQDNIDNVYRGRVTSNEEMLAVFSADDDMGKAIDSWIEKGKFEKLLSLWVKGLSVDWNKLYGSVKPRRISLPTYPFARERYWFPENGGLSAAINAPANTVALHPLLHTNTSGFVGQRFSATFSGEEFFLTDHVVKGQRILPGVAQIEMAIAAVKQSLEPTEHTSALQLKNIVWVQPVIATDAPANIHISLQPEAKDEISFDIYSDSCSDSENTPDADIIIHSQGRITLHPAAAVPELDIAALQHDAESAATTQHISAQQCYQAFANMGLNYGPAFQGLEELFVSPGQILAKISLPDSARDTRDSFTLPPSLLDAALQATIGFNLAERQTNPDADLNQEAELPFALDALELFGSCPDQLWARIDRDEKQGNKVNNSITKLNIDLCDPQGRVCIRMTGLSLRAARVTKSEVLLFQPHWQAQSATQFATQADAHPHDGQRIVMLIDPDQQHLSGLQQHLPDARIIGIQSPQAALEQRYQHHVTQVFNDIKDRLISSDSHNTLLQVVVCHEQENSLFGGLTGLLKTAQLENPKITGQLIEINTASEKITEQTLVNILENGHQHPHELHIRYDESGQCQIPHWQEFPASADILIPWKKDGIYLITGGAGELGLHLAQTIIEHSKGATLILTGRSVPGDVKQQQRENIQQLQALGESGDATVEYHSLDISQRPAVDALVQDILQRHGTLNGIIHSAGVLRDNFILKKETTELHAVLAPKVSGIINLDEASKDIELDLFVVYSSIAATFGNPGQSDYASANAFMDVYIHDRNRLVTKKQRHGHSLSINWPLWKSDGMHVDPITEKLMKERMGMTPMPASTGTQALCHAIASGQNQVMVLHGNPHQLRALLESPVPVQESQQKDQQTSEADTPAENISADTLKEKANHYFKQLLSGVLKLPVARINAKAPMEQYGIDSMMIMQLTSELEKSFGSLSKTLFFEYQSIAALTGYFLENYKALLIELMDIDETAPTKTATKPVTKAEHQAPAGLTGLRSRSSRYISVEQQPASQNTSLDIAIIGVSGRYPQARNLDEFWANLRDGKDCITEVPKERWDWREYYTEDRTRPGSHYSKWGGFLDGVDEFDPLFFNISPREAATIDPQERLFLEQAWAALEDAGYRREDLQKMQGEYASAPVGVYASVMYGEYQLFGAEASMRGDRKGFASIMANIANRVSYIFNLHGPSMTIDTMCSGSLTTLHLACQDLKQGRTDLGIAGGVNVSIHPNKYLMLSAGQFISTAGHCESFGQGGDGYIPGEGVGVTLLKRLADAERDGDHIYGVIKSSAVNHGGKTNGYTVPNPNIQQMAIADAIKEAGIDPRVVSYIEAHGTGTKLGDPIEIAGLSKAFGHCGDEKQFCRIGSVKSNIGHCESAAGIAGLTKVLLQMKHGQIVPSLHSEKLNPDIDFSTTPFIVNQRLTDWNRPVVDGKECPRTAGISAFGAGGSNVHMVIEEYTAKVKIPLAQDVAAVTSAVIVLSAKNEARLNDYARQFIHFLENYGHSQSESEPGERLNDMAWTLQMGREAMEERLAVVVTSVAELKEKLSDFIAGQKDIEDMYRGQVKKIAGIFAEPDTDEDMQKTIDSWIRKRKYTKLADLWSNGVSIDWHLLYGDTTSGIMPCRMSLPSYPFARDHYWATDSWATDNKSVENQSGISGKSSKYDLPEKSLDAELTVNKTKITVKNNHKRKPVGIVLADPLLRITDVSFFPKVKKQVHASVFLSDMSAPSLTPLSAPGPENTENNTSELVEQHEHDKGVFEVRINDIKSNNLLSRQMLHDLHECFGKVCRNKNSKVILLTGQDTCFLSSDVKQQNSLVQEELNRLITECEIPVIAVMKGNATGMGWLVGILCDFMVFCEESIYRYHPGDSDRIPENPEQLFVSKRFGKEIALQLLYSNEQHAGKELKEKGLRLPVLPKKELDSYAMKMACEMADSPREALLQLKKCLGSERRNFGKTDCHG